MSDRDDMGTSIENMQNMSAILRMVLAVTTALVPYTLFLSITVSGANAEKEIIGSIFGILVFPITSSFLLSKLQRTSSTYVLCFAIASFFVCGFIWIGGSFLSDVIYMLLFYWIQHRVQEMYSIKDLSYCLHKAFKIDSLLIAVVIFILWWTHLGEQKEAYQVVNVVISILLMAAICSWLFFFLHTASDTGGTKRVLLILLIISILIPLLWNDRFETPLLIFGILVAIVLLPQVRSTVFSYIVVLFIEIWLYSHSSVHTNKPNTFHKDATSTPNMNHASVPLSLTTIIVINLFLLILITFYTVKRKRVEVSIKQSSIDNSATLVSRVWIRSKNKQVAFLKTTNPVRLTYQKWLKELLSSGVTLNETDTPRTLLRQLGIQYTDHDLTHEYEEVRYGNDHA